MNMTLRGVGYTFGLVAHLSEARAAPVDAPADIPWEKGGASRHLVGEEPVDYSALSEVEWAAPDDEGDNLLAKSELVSRSKGL